MKKIATSILLTGPMLAFAQTPLQNTLTTIKNVVGFVIPLLLSLAVLVFFWGLVKYLMHADDEAEQESGKNLMIWGMIALFVMVAFWGIIGYVQQTIGLNAAPTSASAPQVNVVPPVQGI